MWNWQEKEWPNFGYDLLQIHDLLYQYGKHAGLFYNMGVDVQLDLMIDSMIVEAFRTSEIEGENLNQEEIRSSIRRHLGLQKQLEPISRYALKEDGIALLMLEVRKNFEEELSEDTLYRWHELVMQGCNPYTVYEIGMWRTEDFPMQVVSGPIGREVVHFEAPHCSVLDQEMKQFIAWFNDSRVGVPGPIRAAIAHLYFESIHPFQDGNGRIGRAIVEKILCQDLQHPILFSISMVIFARRKEYYQQLSHNTRYGLDITSWIVFFLKVLIEAQETSEVIIEFTLKKTIFWNKYQSLLNSRQTMMIERMFKEGREGFEGGVNAKKYMSITGGSKATATRDLTELQSLGCLYKLPGEGRNTRYDLQLEGLLSSSPFSITKND